MAVTRLKRKAKRNKTTSKVRVATIQRLNAKPVIKGIDVEKVKEEFEKSTKKAAPKKAKAAAKKEEVKEVAAEKAPAKEKTAKKKEETPKAEKEKAPKAEKKEDSKEEK